MSDFIPRALEECPGWIQLTPDLVAHLSAFKSGTLTDAKTIAAAQRLEWKAKRLAELEAVRELVEAAGAHVASAEYVVWARFKSALAKVRE